MQIPMDSELPLGLGMALARNPAAMAAFTAMSPQERRAVIEFDNVLAWLEGAPKNVCAL